MALEIESEKVKAVAKLLQRCCYAKSEIWYFSTFTFLPTDKNWQSVVFESKSGKIIMQIEMD